METIDIESLRFDDKNFNKHTEFGMSLLERSLRENGAGRSVLVDKNNNLIAGNGIVEAAVAAGFKRVKIVDTDGETLVAVRRPDLELDTAAGRKMALADNATAAADLEWDTEAIAEAEAEYDLDVSGWGVVVDVDVDVPTDLDNTTFQEKPFIMKITFKSDADLKKFQDAYGKVLEDEYKATVSVSGGGL